ncbi:MAG: MarR family transcriptional regulator [Anaerolineae bacterium]|jgi:DNA-binding MarR family transcriptional regulator|nr:MarR family transcriptional regulator [Anaerolineae bacterium]
MNDFEATKAILDWSAIFMRLSMNDFLRFSRSTGLSWMQMAVLMHLHYKGPTEVMACGELLQLSPAGASQMIERLVQQGLAQRSEAPDDRRVRLVHLTDAGRQLVDESIEAQQRWLKPLLATLTEEQRAAATETLRLLTAQATRLETT